MNAKDKYDKVVYAYNSFCEYALNKCITCKDDKELKKVLKKLKHLNKLVEKHQ